MTNDDEEPPVRLLHQSHIDGEFEGWSMGSAFPLENGVVWQQADFKLCSCLLLRPQARVFECEHRYWLQVEGMAGIVAVRRFNPHLPVIGILSKRQQAIRKRLLSAEKKAVRRRSSKDYWHDLIESCQPEG